MYQRSMFDDQIIAATPLAHRIRPNSLDEFAGQEHLVGKGRFLREIIDKD